MLLCDTPPPPVFSSPPLGKITNCPLSVPTQSCTLPALGPLGSTNPLGAGQPKYVTKRIEENPFLVKIVFVIRDKSCNFPEGVVKKISGYEPNFARRGGSVFFSGCIYVMEMDPLLSLSRGYMSEG